MAEIKSAIELAMERTKGLGLSPEEKEKLKDEEIQSRAHSLVNRFLEVDFHFKEVEKELSKYNPQQREHLEDLVFGTFSEAIQLDRDNDLIFQGLETLRKQSKSTNEKIRKLLEEYGDRKNKEYDKIGKDILLKISRLGISGSAVQPKVEGSQEWEGALAKFRPTFEDRLRTLKEELKK